MKLKEGLVTERMGNDFVSVATGEAGKVFNGLIRNNATAQFIFNQLLTERSEQQIVDAVLTKYDISEDVAVQDIHKIVRQLKEAGLLDG